MILLHTKQENNYTTNGLGALDAYIINPIVRWVLNGEYILSFKYPLHVFLGQEIKAEMQVEVLLDEYADVFRIKETKKSMGYLEVYAEHKSYDLIDNFIEDINIVNKTGLEAMIHIGNNLVGNHPFVFDSNITTVASARMVRLGGLQAVIDDSIDNSFISRWGGEIDRNYNNFKMAKSVGLDRGVKIEYAKDLIGYSAKQNVSAVITKIMPIGFDGLLLPEKYVDSPLIDPNRPKIKKIVYGDIKAAIGEYADDEDAIPLEDAYVALRQLAAEEFSKNNIDKPTMSYEVDFALLANTEEYKNLEILQEVQGGDLVEVHHTKDNFATKARVIEYSRNVLTGKYEKVKLGQIEPSMTAKFEELVNRKIQESERESHKLIDTVREIAINAGHNQDAFEYQIKSDNPYGLAPGTYRFNKPIDENPTTVTWEAAGYSYKANSKKPDGTWDWRTIETPDGYIADTMFAGKINTSLIELSSETTLDDELGQIHTDIENIELTPGQSAYEVAVASGFVGTQEEWLASLVGEPGQDGTLYTIGSDGYWYADGVKTSTKAIGQDGANYTIGSDGFWYLNGTKTSYRALGEKGDKGDDGRGVQSIKEYYLASAQNTGVTTSTSGWTETPQTITKAKPYLWNYSVTTYTTGATHTDQPVIIGTVGDDGVGIQSVQEYYLISNQATGVTHSTSGWTTTPPSFTDAKRFLWNYEKITYTDSSVTNTAPALIGVKGEQGDNFAWNLLKGTSDQLKQVSISGWGVTNASSLHPDNANLFSDGVISAGDTVTLRVWLDASQSAYPVRASIRYPNNGNPNRNTITNLIPAGQSGWATATATIPDDTTNFFVLITVFNQGSTPSQNIGYKYLMLNKGDAQPWSPHPDDLKALQTYTWIRYADSATGSGISNDPTGKTYIGFAYNKTTATESNTPSDYTWSLIKGTDGQPGAPGQDGTTTYTWIKYSDNADGTGLYDLPKSTTEYIGIAVNKTTATESTNKADYTWSKFRGGQGVPGTDGTGIQSIIVEYGISGTTAPTTWSTTPPESWDDDKYLWIRNKITYTDSTVAYAGTNRLSDVEAQRALVKAKEYTDNVKIGGKNIIKNSNDFSAFYAFSGATLTKTENVSVSEWNATDATNLKTTGGTNVLKIIQRYEVPEVIHKEIVTYSIYVKNNGTNNITVRVNGVGAGTSETIEPGAAVRFVRFGEYRSEAYYNWFQFQIYASNAAENIDVDLWHDQLERGNKETDWSPAPEDFQTQITENRNDIDQYGMRVTEVEHTVNGYGSEVGLVARMTNVEAGEITLSTLTNGVLAGMTLSSSMLRATGGGYGVQVSGTAGYLPFYVGDTTFTTSGAQFYVDWSGFLYAKNANIEGTVTATAGVFAGLTISQNNLRAISGDYGVQISGVVGNLPLYVGDTTFTANGAKFYVDWTGHLYSKSANIEGTFVATGGSIGGLTITGSTLRTATSGYGVQVSGAAGYLPFYVGNSSFSAAGAKFYVDWSGYLFANNASIKGSIQAGSVIAGQLNDTTGTHRGSHVGSYAGTASTYSGSNLGGSLDYTIGSHKGSINCNTGVLGNVSFYSTETAVNFAGAIWCVDFRSRNNVIVDYNISYGGTLTHTSDKNLKTDIELPDVDTYLDSFYSLKVKNFVFKNDENKKRRLGIVAQDFIEDNSNNLIKEVVVPIEGYFHVNYEHLYLMNILATQDLNSRLKRLEEKLSA